MQIIPGFSRISSNHNLHSTRLDLRNIQNTVVYLDMLLHATCLDLDQLLVY